MKVLIAELFWQHTEVLGTWIDYFIKRGDEVTIFYPKFLKTPHNYVNIWASIYKIQVNYDGLLNIYDFDIVVLNTQNIELVKRLRIFNKPLIEINHYAAGPATATATYEIAVNPFRCPRKFVLPIAPALADILAASRHTIPNSKKITIIGNSFMSMPATLFKQLIQILTVAGWTVKGIIYDYNTIDEYISEHITFKKNCLAIDLFKEIEETQFILFYPSPFHFYNQLSGSIVLSLLFGRPLLTIQDILTPYNINCYYNINDPSFIYKLNDIDYYKSAQQHLEVRLNEFICDGRKTLDSVVEKVLSELQTTSTMQTTATCD